MKVTVIPMVIGGVGTTPKGFVKEVEKMEIEGRNETIQSMLSMLRKKWVFYPNLL